MPMDTDEMKKMQVVVRSQVKEIAKSCEHTMDNIAGDFADKLEAQVVALIKEACKRAHGNGRRTLMARDL